MPMKTPWVEGNGDGVTEVLNASCMSYRRLRADGDYANHPEDSWGDSGTVTDGR